MAPFFLSAHICSDDASIYRIGGTVSAKTEPEPEPESPPGPRAPLNNDIRFPALYGELGNQIRHFSTVRSSLTTFLLTVGLAAFVASAERDADKPYLLASGVILMVMALCVCFIFSWQTEKHVLRYKAAWNWGRNTNLPFPDNFKDTEKSDKREIAKRVRRDPMNYLALGMVALSIALVTVPLEAIWAWVLSVFKVGTT